MIAVAFWFGEIPLCLYAKSCFLLNAEGELTPDSWLTETNT